MKRILTFFMALLTVTSLLAQQNILLEDFESGAITFTTQVNVNPPAHMDVAIVDNPVKSGINTSNKVWEWKRYDAAPDNKTWAGFWAILKNEVPSGYHRLEVKYLRKNATSQLRIKLEGAVNKEFMPVNLATKTNQWETMVFDLTANGIKNIRVLSLFPDYYEPIDPAAITYIDDIRVIFDPTIVEPPAPTTLILFDNSASDRFHDQSWSTKTAPSTLVQEHWQGPALPDGDKLPCVTSPVKSSPNALKLQWKSVETGSWMALVASIGWKVFDLKKMTMLRFWVNSPVNLDKAALPKFFFESHSGTPNKTGKLPLANYLKNGLTANTWTEVRIPLSEVWAADTAFKAKDVVKGVFFEQNVADNVERTLYLDEFVFDSSRMLFENSTSDRFHDQSYTAKTAPSTLLQEHWQGPGLPDGDKLPSVTSPVISSPNALKLQWKSATGGSWMAMVASVGWLSFDLTQLKTLTFYINSPVALAKTALPKIFLEAHSGNPNKTGKLMLGKYLTADLVANTWTVVNIPLIDFWVADPAFLSQSVVKGVFFEQNLNDNVEHTLFMDNFNFTDIAVTPPVLETFILFDNSTNNRFYDQSWSTKTAPSTLLQEHWQGPGLPDGDKLPCDTVTKKSAPNALKLQWKSVTGGSWMALVGSVGWKSFDLKKADYLRFSMRTPQGFPRTALPKVFLESHSGNPNKSGKLNLMNYVPGDLSANTWIEVLIPLKDFWAADPAYTAMEVVKGVFFEQNLADNAEHTLYLDDFTFLRTSDLPAAPVSLILFENSASDRFHDQSFSAKTAPSTLVQEHWQGPGLPDGDKLPCVTTPVKSAPNALKLQWKSTAGGSWMALVAALNWKSFDVRELHTLRFWVYSPTALDKTVLPKIFLESHSGNPNKTGKVLLAAYLPNGLTAAAWTEVNVPLAALWAADPAFTAKDVVKGVFFEQNLTDNVEHTLFLDEFSFISRTVGAIDIGLPSKTITAYYYNGEIRVMNYSGFVRVYDLMGRNVAQGNAPDGNIRVNLKKGIYIVNTTEGNSKIALP